MSKWPNNILGKPLVLITVFTSSQAYYLRDQDTWTKIDYSAKVGHCLGSAIQF